MSKLSKIMSIFLNFSAKILSKIAPQKARNRDIRDKKCVIKTFATNKRVIATSAKLSAKHSAIETQKTQKF